jgi:asparagine synthase (glutamine-hydrolysing)
MNAELAHRGPDATGEHVNGPVALAHQRLSIVDVARGQQPMKLPGTPYCIVYNGEAYNHVQLRQRLPAPPSGYRTSCDTETILAAYHQLGDACVEQLSGMFALAIHDDRDHSMFLARDRLGIKPLYYYLDDELFAFASEIKSLLAHPGITARVNVDRLPIQLSLKYTLDEHTLFAGICKVLPGTCLRLTADGLQHRQYWDLSFAPKEQPISLAEAAHAFRDHFVAAVESHLMADVPVGVFLSGGIDSAAIASCMSQLGVSPLKTFTADFDVRGYSELPYVRLAAGPLRAEQRAVTVTADDFFALWPQMVYHEDEPIAHPSSIALHCVSRLAAEEVKVVLTGEGADELLGGYERYYQTLANLRLGRLVPSRLRRWARAAIDRLPDQHVAKRKAVRTALYLPGDVQSLFLDNYAAFTRSDLTLALRPQYRTVPGQDIFAPFAQLMEQSDAEDLLEKILYADMKTYLLELLMKQDQMSMSASLESRVPFLDEEMVDFVCRLPVALKVRGLATKRILRQAVRGLVPDAIIRRRKRGFPTPIREWFRGGHQAVLQRLLLSSDSRSAEYVCPDFTRQILQRHVRGVWDHQEQLWTLGNLELWLRIFIEGQSPQEALPDAQEVRACVSCG